MATENRESNCIFDSCLRDALKFCFVVTTEPEVQLLLSAKEPAIEWEARLLVSSAWLRSRLRLSYGKSFYSETGEQLIR